MQHVVLRLYTPGLLQDNITVPAGLDSLIPIPTVSVPVSPGAVGHSNGNRQPIVACAPRGNRVLALFANDLAATCPSRRTGAAQRSAWRFVSAAGAARAGQRGAGRALHCCNYGGCCRNGALDRQRGRQGHTGVGTQGAVPDALNPFKTPPSAIMAYPSVRSSLFIAPDPHVHRHTHTHTHTHTHARTHTHTHMYKFICT
jgi:hypothetical protein